MLQKVCARRVLSKAVILQGRNPHTGDEAEGGKSGGNKLITSLLKKVRASSEKSCQKRKKKFYKV